MDYIKEKFAVVEDKRHQSYVEHNLVDVLIIIMCSVLCGLDGLAELTLFAQKRAKFFRNKFGIEKVPSKPTFSRILDMMDGEKVSKVIVEIMLERAKFIKHISNIVAVDGKTIRSTTKEGAPNSAMQILTAYLTESAVVLGQKVIYEKNNEIPVFQEMLEYLDVSGKIVTADAMHCQTKTCKKIIERGGDYVFGLKKNHKIFYDEVKLFFESEACKPSIQTYTAPIEKNGGRIERRICQKITDISWFADLKKWEGLKTVFSIRRIVTTKNKTTDETCYYIASLDTDPKELLNIVRRHWQIESMHWLLDVVFSEDDCKLLSDNGNETLNILRKLALLLHKQFLAKQSKKCSIKSNLLSCLMDEEYLWEMLESL